MLWPTRAPPPSRPTHPIGPQGPGCPRRTYFLKRSRESKKTNALKIGGTSMTHSIQTSAELDCRIFACAEFLTNVVSHDDFVIRQIDFREAGDTEPHAGPEITKLRFIGFDRIDYERLTHFKFVTARFNNLLHLPVKQRVQLNVVFTDCLEHSSAAVFTVAAPESLTDNAGNIVTHHGRNLRGFDNLS